MLLRLFLLSTVFIGLILCAGCGKDPEKGDSRAPTGERRTAISPQILDFIKRQQINCEDKFLCQESIAKLVVIDNQSIRYCTAALIAENVMVTSASCLTRSLQIPNLDCTENIFAIFPQTNIQTQQTYGCDRILSADINEDVDKALWSSDVAFITLKEGPTRRPLVVSKEGLSDKKSYSVWKGNYLSDTDTILEQTKCHPIFNGYMNPFASHEKSPFVPLGDCKFIEGNTGGIVLNDNDEVVGIVSSELDFNVREFVLSSGWLKGQLNDLFHISNMACVQLPIDHQTDEVSDACHGVLTQTRLDWLRAGLLKTKGIHANNINLIQSRMQKIQTKYFQWDFAFLPGKSGDTYELHMQQPRCYFDTNKWIHEFRSWGRIRTYGLRKFSFPNYQLKSGLSGDLTPMSILENLDEKQYVVEFNPRGAWSWGKSYAKITANFFGIEKETRYEDITSDCK